MQVQLTEAELPQQASEHTVPTLDGLAREGARRMLALALELEVAEYIGQHQDCRAANGHRLVVRNGKARERKVLIGGLPVPDPSPRAGGQADGGPFTNQIPPPH